MLDIKAMVYDYLDKIEYMEIEVDNLTVDMINKLERQSGYVVPSSNGIPFFINRKVEPMKILNTVTVFELVDTFTITDSFGLENWSDNAEGCLEYLKSLNDDSEIDEF